MRNPHKPWNRSSALTLEELGTVNSAMQAAVDCALIAFHKSVDVASLSDEQRAEAYRLLADGVTAGIAKRVEVILHR